MKFCSQCKFLLTLYKQVLSVCQSKTLPWVSYLSLVANIYPIPFGIGSAIMPSRWQAGQLVKTDPGELSFCHFNINFTICLRWPAITQFLILIADSFKPLRMNYYGNKNYFLVCCCRLPHTSVGGKDNLAQLL